MSSAIVTRGSKLFSIDEVTPILNTADFWLDMSDSSYFTTSSTTRINTLTDKSATPKTITRNGNISYDTLRRGIKPAGTAGTDFLTVNLASPATGTIVSETVFVVGYTSNTGTSAFLGGTAGGTRTFYISSTGLLYGPYGGTNVTASVSIPTMTLVVGCAQLTSSTNVNLYYNGRFITSGSPGGFSASSTTQNIFRGGGVTTFYLRGAVYEMLIFQSALTNTQINIVNDYLMNKWKVVTTSTSLISSPLSISGCSLWLDGNDASTITFGTGTAVAQWNDKSGNGFHATQSTPSKQPTYDSTLKGLLFNGANLTLFNTTCPFSPTETVFIVANASTLSTSSVIIGTTNASFGRYFSMRTTTAVLFSNATTLYTARYNSIGTTDRHLIHWINDGTNGFFEAGYNTVQDFDNTSAFTYQAGSFNNVIGATTTSGGTNTYNTYIYEVIIFNSPLSVSDRRSICQYLTNKWTITNNAPRTDTYLYPFYNSRPFIRPFNPLDFDGCTLWLDAGDSTTLTLSGSSVTTWTDKSPSNFNATTFNTSPTFSNTAVNFSGTQGLTTSLSASTNIESAFFVFGSTDVTAVNTLVGGATSSGGRQFRMTSGDLQTLRQDVAGVVFGGSPPLVNNVRYLAEYVNNGTTLIHYLNGTVHRSGSAAAYTAGILTSIGLRAGNLEGLRGYINEMIIYSRALSTNERQQIESYLAQKWGLINSLPGHLGRSGNYLSINPTTVASNCALWLDASDPSNTGVLPANLSSLSTWVDKSGNGRNAIAVGTAPTFYTAGLNSRPSVFFNSNLLRTAGWSLAPSRQFAWFVVVNVTSTVNGYQRILIANGGQYFSGSLTTNANTTNLLGVAGSTTFTAPISTGTVNPGIGTYAFGTSEFGSNVGAVNANGGIPVQLSGNTGSLGTNGLEIGFETGNASAALTGFVSEIICYSGDVTQLQRQTIEAYLSQKWALTSLLPANHVGRLYQTLSVPFDPRQLASCVLWLDFADSASFTLSGSNLSSLTDKSGTGRVITINSAPTYSAKGFNNAYPCFVFTTSNFLTTTLSTAIGTGNCVFVAVMRNTSTNAQNNVLTVGVPAGGTEMGMGWNNGESRYKFYQFGSGEGVTSGVGNSINMISIGTRISSTMSIFVNGSSPASTGTNSVNNTNTAVHIGNNTTFAFAGQICEILLYTGTITVTQRQRLEGYLAHKWGLQASLPSTHPYRKTTS